MTARLAVALLPLLLVATVAAGPRLLPALVAAPNADGMAVTLSAGGGVTADHPFFRGFGESGRACATCHAAADGWSLVPASVQHRFEATGGLDPLFLPHDAAVSPRADVTTLPARRRAYALVLTRG